MRKQLIVAGITTAVGVTGLAGMSVASAATDTAKAGPMSSMVETLSEKFSLDKSQVQSVFNEQHDKMEAEREAAVQKKIAQLVTDKKITQVQADKINAKRAELEKERDTLRDSSKTREEIKDVMQSKRTELEAWADANDIDRDYLRYVMGGGRGHGPGGASMRFERGNAHS